MAYVALHDQDQIHLYGRLDDSSFSDGGKLRMEDSALITPFPIHKSAFRQRMACAAPQLCS